MSAFVIGIAYAFLYTQLRRESMRDLAFLELDAVEEHRELRARQRHAIDVRTSEWSKSAFLQSLVVKPKAVPIELKELHSIATLVQEHEHVAAQRVE